MNSAKTVRAIAAFDFLTTIAFILPWTAKLYLGLFYQLHAILVETRLPGFEGDTLALAFVNIMGVLAVIWAIVRWRDPTLFYGRLDAFGRLIVAALLLFHVAGGLSPIFLIFVVTEIAGSLIQFSLRSSANESPGSSA